MDPRCLPPPSGDLHGLFDVVPAGLMAVSPTGRVLRVNARAAAVLGSDPGLLLDKSIVDLVHPGDRDRWVSFWAGTSAGEARDEGFVGRVTTEAGSHVHAHIAVSPVRGSDGIVEHVMAVVREVSPVGGDGADTVARFTVFEDAIESVSQTIIVYDRDDRIALFNQRFLEWYPELADIIEVGTHFEDVIRTAYDRGLIRDAGDDIETVVRNRERDFRAIDGPPVRRFLADGRVLQVTTHRTRGGGTVIVGTDVTTLLAQEAALQRSEEQFRSIVAELPMAFALKDEAGRYVIVNRTFEEWYGLDSAEVVGKNAFDFYPQELAQWAWDHYMSVFSGRQAITEERDVVLADGKTHRMSFTSFPVSTSDGDVLGVGSLGFDVTAARETEAQLRQAQRMEVVGQLTGGVAHDFNNLLTIISGSLEFALRFVENDRVRRLVGNSLKAAGTAADLVRQLLAFARRQPLDPKPVEVGDLVVSMLPLLERTLGAHITVDVEIASDLWVAHVDAGQLESAILNLCLNARDAMAPGGTLTIQARNVPSYSRGAGDAEHGSGEPGDFVLVSVRDTGVGIREEHRARVIEPFFTTKGVGEGSGLGLSMVFGFVSQSGGHLEIDSEEGAGTTVHVYIPRSEGEAPRSRLPDAVESLPHGGETVLVVEDEPDVREYAVEVLSDLGYRVLAAVDGVQAVGILEAEARIDVLFSDVVMPGGLSGREVADRAILLHPGIAVLFASGYSKDVLLDEGRLRPGVHLLSKPYGPGDVARAIRTLLDAV